MCQIRPEGRFPFWFSFLPLKKLLHSSFFILDNRSLRLLLLACSLLLSSCSQSTGQRVSSKTEIGSQAEDTLAGLNEFHAIIPEYNNLNDPDLLRYVEDSIYAEAVNNLDDGYFVQNVSAVYVSREYLKEVSYNSKSNIFFGYTLAELDEQFQGTRIDSKQISKRNSDLYTCWKNGRIFKKQALTNLLFLVFQGIFLCKFPDLYISH